MKIGIITFQCAHNYGAVLQAYALQEYLVGHGHKAFIIDYNPIYKTREYAIFSIYHWASRSPLACIKRLFVELCIKRIRIKRWIAFKNFKKNRFLLFPFKKEYDNNDFDVIILGSDQIWNPDRTGGKLDGVFWGDGISCPVISYAASSRKLQYDNSEMLYIKERLHRMKSISVREDILRKALQPLVDTPISVVLDPTLLAGVDIFKRISKKPPKNDYILVYEIKRNQQTQEFAERISKNLNLPIVELVNSPIWNSGTLHQTASPEEFVGYFENASAIITTSFHGVVFAFLFRRIFYALKQYSSADNRLYSFLSNVGLSDRFIDFEQASKTNEMGSIDYTIPMELYAKERKKSMDFIKGALRPYEEE